MTKHEGYTAEEIAQYFIKKSVPGTQESITNLKLQKILYYSQGFYYAINGKKLFKEDIEAWVHGPVVRSIYGKYAHNNFRAITNENETLENPVQDSDIQNFLNDVWELLKDYSGKQLERKTHLESPWQNTRGDAADYEYTNEIIPVENIADYFTKNYLK